MDVDEAIDQLVDAMQTAGAPSPQPPDDLGALDAIDREIAPLRLPHDARRLWERVSPVTFRLDVYPQLTDPARALDSWRLHRDTVPGMVPRVLFPLCYESWNFYFVELAAPGSLGVAGALFEWGYGGCPFGLRHHGVAEWLDTLAAVFREGAFEWYENQFGAWLRYDRDRYRRIVDERLARGPAHPIYGRTIEFDEDVRRWPEHWRRLSGAGEEVSRPRGATHTIAQVMEETARGPVRATIAGLVTRLAGSGAGSQVTVDDGTGTLEVWCPAAVTTFGPVIRRRFEFDIVVAWTARAEEVADSWAAMQGEGADEVAQIAARFHGSLGADGGGRSRRGCPPVDDEDS